MDEWPQADRVRGPMEIRDRKVAEIVGALDTTPELVEAARHGKFLVPIADAWTLLRELVAQEWTDHPHDDLCVFCGAYCGIGRGNNGHEVDCLWRRAKELVG